MRIPHKYKARALDSLLETQAAPKHHAETMAEKRRLDIFEATMKMETTEQTNLPRHALEIIDYETDKEI